MFNYYPKKLNILGIEYKIQYIKNAGNVDPQKREVLSGQVDFWTRTIRIHVNERPIQDVWQTLWHEIIHTIGTELHIEEIKFEGENDNKEKIIDLLATGINDVLFRNKIFGAVTNGKTKKRNSKK